ncbi:MAG: hypothetical protein ABEI52_05720, partial [Halobacteriaceae archaeon]
SVHAVKPESGESVEQAWVGEGVPVGASKPLLAAYHNRLSRTPADGDIDIVVACNDEKMNEESGIARQAYGNRDLPFDVSLERDLTVSELRECLQQDVDLFHYIGHIDGGGFECVNGKLDASTLGSVGVDAFFLNACQSYEQGLELIQAGAVGGVVTLRDVVNTGAVKIGRT